MMLMAIRTRLLLRVRREIAPLRDPVDLRLGASLDVDAQELDRAVRDDVGEAVFDRELHLARGSLVDLRAVRSLAEARDRALVLLPS